MRAPCRQSRTWRPAGVVLCEQLTGHGTRQLLRHGAAGILRRGTAALHLSWAVAAVAQGGLALDPCLTEAIKSAYARPTPPDREGDPAEALVPALTPREREILSLVGDGLPNRKASRVETRRHAARVAWHAGVGATRRPGRQVPESV